MSVFRFVCSFSVLLMLVAVVALAQEETPAAPVPAETVTVPEVVPETVPVPVPDTEPDPEAAPATEAAPAPKAMPEPEPVAAEAVTPETGVRAATFVVDITPPIGCPLCLGGVAPAKTIEDPLTARGLIFQIQDKKPIAMIAVDWVGIANDAHTAWRAAVAEAISTDVQRVAVHTLHQHDAPGADFGVEALLEQQGLGGKMFDVAYAHATIQKVAEAAHHALATAQPITHFGTGQATVEMVASNRRILNEAGKVASMRYTACADPELRAAPEGVIDPLLRSLSFWNGDTPVAVLTFYATHPQSHYGKGGVSWDYPGLARAARERAVPEATHIHFTGAGGNIGAGKYNDGSPENRYFLAGRVALAMRQAWESTVKKPLEAKDMEWRTQDVLLPPRSELNIQTESEALADEANSEGRRMGAARELFWLQRCAAQDPITLTALRVADTFVLGMPGELFVEYQLAAQGMLPENFVAMAAYADYGPGYICTAKGYEEGGYEAQLYTSRTSPAVEEVLMGAMGKLLGK